MTPSEDRITQMLDSLQTSVNEINITLAKHLARDEFYQKRDDRTYKAVFGNGRSIGIRAKMWVIWGGLCLSYAVLIGILIRYYS